MTNAEAFRREYERINRTVYGGNLPPFPGAVEIDRSDLYAATNTSGAGRWRRLDPFLVSKHLAGPILLESIRHEIAHAAALLYDEDEGHGPAWKAHALRCGAEPVATLDWDHPLRQEFEARQAPADRRPS
jgi:hypothetical protein